MSRKLAFILNYALENDLEIVSYGLAPNPDGFCFEAHPSRIGARIASEAVRRNFATMLGSLTRKETEELKKAVF